MIKPNKNKMQKRDRQDKSNITTKKKIRHNSMTKGNEKKIAE